MTSPSAPRSSGPGRRDLAVACLLVVVVGGVYLRSSTRGFLDPKFALLTSQSLLERGSWDLAPYFPGLECAPDAPVAQIRKDAYQIFCVGGRALYVYPPGGSLLSLPFVAVLRALGHSAVRPDGRYDLAGELAMQDRVAASVAALAVAWIFLAARRELPVGAAVAVALVAAFGTTLWSTASQQVWSHTWSALLVAMTLVELQRWEAGAPRRPVWLGALLVAAFWCRPTNAVLAACATAFVVWRYRAAAGRLLAVGVAGLAAYVGWSWRLFGGPVPLYVRHAAGSEYGSSAALDTLAGVLFAPTVGLFVFTPVLLVVAVWLARYPWKPERRPLAGWAVAVVVLGTLPFALRSAGWGGGPRGPRFFTELVPLFAWLAALAWSARRARPAGRKWTRVAASGLAVALAGASVGAQFMISTRFGTPWNDPLEALRLVDGRPYDPDKIWAWKELPQVALWRTLTEEPPPRTRRRANPSP